MSQIMNSMPRHWISGSFHFGWTVIVLCTVGLPMIVGCGGSDSSNSTNTTVVTPPPPAASNDGEPSLLAEPPGGLEMPSGNVPLVTPEENASSDENGPAKSGGLEMPKQTETPPADSGASSGQQIQYGSWDEIQQQVTSSGQITVVDLWSLACEPCLKEFPGLVRLHQSHGSTVRCIAVDMDYDGRKSRPPQYYEERVAAFLESVGADFTTYISSTPSEDIYAATKLDSIPAVLIYDAQGKIVKVFADSGDTIGFSYDKDIIPLVAKLAG